MVEFALAVGMFLPSWIGLNWNLSYTLLAMVNAWEMRLSQHQDGQPMATVKIYLASTELEAAMLGPMETFTATMYGEPIGALQRPKRNQQEPITVNSAIQQTNWKMDLIGLLPDAACAVLRTKR